MVSFRKKAVSFLRENGLLFLPLPVIWILYGASCRYGFLTALDDSRFVTENPHLLSSLENFLFYLKNAYAELYTPLAFWSLMLDHAVSGLSPWMYHFHNLFLFSVCSVLFGILLRKTGLRRWIACACVLLWCMSPQRLESAVWISERKDLLCGLFSLCSALLILRAKGRWTSLLPAGICFLLAMLAKPAATGLLFLPPAVYLFRGGWPLVRRNWKQCLVLPGIFLLYLPFFRQMMQSVRAPEVDSFSRSVFVCLHNILFYLTTALFPPECNILYPLADGSDLVPLICFSVILTGLILLLFRRSGLLKTRRLRLFLGAGAVWIGFFASASGVLIYNPTDYADRYNFLPAMVLLAFLGLLLSRSIAGKRLPSVPVFGCLLLLILWNACVTWNILPYWNGEEIFVYSLANTRSGAPPNETLLGVVGGHALNLRNAGLCANAALGFQRNRMREPRPRDTAELQRARENTLLLFHLEAALLRGDETTFLRDYALLRERMKQKPFSFLNGRSYTAMSYLLIYEHLMQTGKPAAAGHLLDSAVDSCLPDEGSASLFLRGMHAYRHGDYRSALAYWKRFLILSPQDEKTRHNVRVLEEYLSTHPSSSVRSPNP